MKKIISTLLLAALSVSLLAGCSNGAKTESTAAGSSEAAAPSSSAELKKIVIGASPTPHAEILKQANELLK
ncbi:MAG TPA: metal ABC transporter substrate-binding protein, partial [Ruminococcaceae bacterium]|nr:metal ABC transporter substrate-binding protein [Oscillospiraceae bacterium]